MLPSGLRIPEPQKSLLRRGRHCVATHPYPAADPSTLSLSLLTHTHTLPPVPLSVTLRGGTTVSHSPSIDYFTLVTAPLLRRMGIHTHTTIKRRG